MSYMLTVIKGAISVTPCRALRSLSLHNPLSRAMVAFLAEVPADNLQTLTFHVTLAKSFDPENPDGFEELAAEVESRRYKHVETVRFVHDGFIPLAEVRRGLQRAFPSLHARGALNLVERERG